MMKIKVPGGIAGHTVSGGYQDHTLGTGPIINKKIG